jgi:hypothetical protein
MEKLIETYLSDSSFHLLKSIQKENAGLILVYFGSDFDYVSLYHDLKKSRIPFMGCMDTGRLFNKHYYLDSTTVAAMVLHKDLFEKLEIATFDMRTSNPYQTIKEMARSQYESLFAKTGIDPANPDLERDLAINLLFGLQSANPVLEAQTETSLYFQTAGGSSGGKLDFKSAPVISSKGYGNLGVTAMIRLNKEFAFRSDLSSSFEKTGHTLQVTKLGGPREILEFNGQPALQEYARTLGISQSDLGPGTFAIYTLGLDTGDGERLITSIQQSNGNGGLLTYNDVSDGITFQVYSSISQREPRKEKFQTLNIKQPLGILSFDCVLCYLARNALQEVDSIANLYEEVFPDVPKIGFGTFSENYCGANVNQTETFLIIYRKEG